MGEPIEHEHTKDHDLAKDISLQHLDEIPDYYTRLKKMEADAKKKSVSEENLRQWFKGSKSKDGKPGWVNVVTGGTCASDEPGEGTPKCVSSSKRASMTPEERRSAARRKKAADPGQQQKTGAAKPTYVSTDKPKKMNEESDVKGKGSGKKDACYRKVKSRYDVWPSAYASGALVKCRKVGAANWGTKSESTDNNALSYDWDYPINSTKERYCPKCEKMETANECRYGSKFWSLYSLPSEPAKETKKELSGIRMESKEKDHEYSMARSQISTIISAANRLKKKMGKGEGNLEAWVQSKISKASDYLDSVADYIDSGEHDIEESKIQPPMERLKTDRNMFNIPSDEREAAKQRLLAKTSAKRKEREMKEHRGIVAEILKDIQEEDPCWKGYKQVGMKKKGNRMVPNCVKEEEIEEAVRLPATNGNIISVIISWRGKTYMNKMFFPQVRVPNKKEVTDQIQKVYPGATVLQYNVSGLDPGQPMIQVYDPQRSKNYLLNNKNIGEEFELEEGMSLKDYKRKRSALKQKEKRAADKIAPGRRTGIHADKASPERAARHRANIDPDYDRDDEEDMYPGGKLKNPKKIRKAKALGELGEDWQKVNRQDKTDGLSQAAVNAYRRENPGSKLKTAVTEKNPTGKRAQRRKSFCSRMKGMKKRLTSAETSRDPDSRINKALRRWNCN